ncbi:serine hydrolase [Candidatus Saccharibacteria bacterium]|nr:serine hydrolase [Candidatus Saccharibacteria bacterium]
MAVEMSGPLVYVPKKGPNASRFQTPKERKKQHKKSKTFQTILDIVVIILVAGATYAMFKLTNVKPENQEVNNPSVVSSVSDEEPEAPAETKTGINLQPVIDSWLSLSMQGAEFGVTIIDLEDGEVVGSVNIDRKFSTASVYKLFVAYEGYRRVENGEFGGEDAAYGGYTVNECLDLMIRESHSGCAENIAARIGWDNLDYIIYNQYGLENTNISSFTSTPGDVADMLELFFRHKDFSNETYAKFLDSMLNQPISDPSLCGGGRCDWRQGLPKGFTRGTKVYNKVGWDYNGAFWVIYNDAAILEFPEQNRHFAVAVMSERLSNVNSIVQFGDMLEEAILAYISEE